METVIGAVRLTGSRNVVVADGLDLAETLDGAPLIQDVRDQVAYAVHPYFDAGLANDAAGWTQRFGNFAGRAPVIATEWNTPATLPYDGRTPQQALGFLRYLQSAGIGLAGYGYDFVAPSFGAIVTAFDPGTPNPPTTYVGQNCLTNPDGVTSSLTPDFGPGRIIQDWCRTGMVPASPE